MHDRIQTIQEKLAEPRERIVAHPLYQQLHELGALQIFMQHHVFAVWDFMSLLKSLQGRIAGARVPWTPPTHPVAARFVNEIVLAEETDVTSEGVVASHFELYRQAMQQAAADLSTVDAFLQTVRADGNLADACRRASVPQAAQEFLLRTFALIARGDVRVLAAEFAFGREDLLPDVFLRMVESLNDQLEGSLDAFCYYLQRHVELDGDHHGPLAHQLIIALCGDCDASWERVEQAALDALWARKRFWDGIQQNLPCTSSRAQGARGAPGAVMLRLP